MDNLTIALFLITYFGLTFVMPIVMLALAITSVLDIVSSRISK